MCTAPFWRGIRVAHIAPGDWHTDTFRRKYRGTGACPGEMWVLYCEYSNLEYARRPSPPPPHRRVRSGARRLQGSLSGRKRRRRRAGHVRATLYAADNRSMLINEFLWPYPVCAAWGHLGASYSSLGKVQLAAVAPGLGTSLWSSCCL